ncbi:acyltransferase [Acinetobacter soli]|uniref:acyltransferase n=1 Tax=Acinetobacter soli TaxID=487316 RepID=UPI00125DC68A|nr:DapH/DapD/GlmU-related protein [Acinetobacter soli]MCF3128334.1 hypothetical protein [Acinetobacter soli]
MKNYLINIIFSFLPATKMFKFKVLLLNFFGMDISPNARLCGNIKIYGRGKLIIGDDTFIGIGTCFILAEDAPIIIGKNCDIAPYCIFHTGSHEIGPSSRRAGTGFSKQIIIKDGVWIGCRSTILYGVSIDSGSIIAATSTVLSGDYEKDILIAGIPARKKRYLDNMEI